MRRSRAVRRRRAVSSDPRRRIRGRERARVRTHRPLVRHAPFVSPRRVFSWKYAVFACITYHSKHLSLVRFTFSRAPRALVRAVSALRRRARRARRVRRVRDVSRLNRHRCCLLSSRAFRAHSSSRRNTSLRSGRDIEHRRRFRSRARADRVDAPRRASVVRSHRRARKAPASRRVFSNRRAMARGRWRPASRAGPPADAPSPRSRDARRARARGARRGLSRRLDARRAGRRSIVARTRRLHGERSGGGI